MPNYSVILFEKQINSTEKKSNNFFSLLRFVYLSNEDPIYLSTDKHLNRFLFFFLSFISYIQMQIDVLER